MAVNIHSLIAAISPDTYLKKIDEKTGKSPVAEIKKMVSGALAGPKDEVKSRAYLDAAQKISDEKWFIESEYIDIQYVRHMRSAFALEGKKNPVEKHTLNYDAFSQSLEPIYFWILDYINYEYEKTEKLVDNFVSSVASGHFAEIQGRATRMQEEAMKMLGSANTVLRSVLNIVYDLKEFQIRLAPYDDLEEPERKRAAFLSLKQIWVDQVDIKRGNSSIKALAVGGANQPNFVTLLDAFFAFNSLKEVKEADLNDRVKRILEQRIPEFERWVRESKQELTKRFNIEKTYLKSQVNALKIYAQWIKPYLKAAAQLEQRASPTSSALVNSFNTALFELTLLGLGKYDQELDIQLGELPRAFRKLINEKKIRLCLPVVIVEFKFRSVPDRTDQRGGYTFRGRAEIAFTSYSLNNDELKVLREQIEKDDFGDIYKLISGATTESLGEIQADIDTFLETKKSEEKEEKDTDDTNPFTALFSFLKKSDKKKSDASKGIKPDTPEEAVIRSQAALESRWKCRKLYNDYKKSLDMPTLPPVFK